jgi:hypothetical protein
MWQIVKCFMQQDVKCFKILADFSLTLFVWLFTAAGAIFQLSGGCHHYRWQGCKLRPCLAPMTFWDEGSFRCHTCCDTGSPFLRSYPKNLWFSFQNATLLAKEQPLPILTLRFDATVDPNDLPDAKEES